MSLILGIVFAIIIGMGGVELAQGITGGINPRSVHPPRKLWHDIRAMGATIILGFGGVCAGFLFGFGIGQVLSVKVIVALMVAIGVVVAAGFGLHHFRHHGASH